MNNFKKTDSKEPSYYISVPNNSHFSRMKVKKLQDDGDYTDYICVREKKNAEILCGRLKDVISGYFHKEAKDEKRVLFHITMSECSHFSGLTCIRKCENPAIKESYKECLYFEENEREKAQCVLHNIKRCIYNFFHDSVSGEACKDCPKWLDEGWRDKCECK